MVLTNINYIYCLCASGWRLLRRLLLSATVFPLHLARGSPLPVRSFRNLPSAALSSFQSDPLSAETLDVPASIDKIYNNAHQRESAQYRWSSSTPRTKLKGSAHHHRSSHTVGYGISPTPTLRRYGRIHSNCIDN